MTTIDAAHNTIPAPATGLDGMPLAISELTTEELASLIERGGAVALLPVGSIEPHGPHLPLSTDVVLSDEACRRAALSLRASGRPAAIAASIPYGVTRYARGFKGAIGVSAETLIALVSEVVRAHLDDGFEHVAVVNNHLEPAHVAALAQAVAAVAGERGPEHVSFPNQLDKRWARTLTDEFKRGDCHAGCYETSLVLAAKNELVREGVARELPTLAVSLASAIKAAQGGEVTFAGIGMSRAYTGAPKDASPREGDASYGKLVDMIVTEIREHLDVQDDTSQGDVPQIVRSPQ